MDRIGKYTIEKKLGQGGMGIVYKCLDTEQQRPAAVKVLPQQLAADPVFLQRFKREMMTLQRLDNPHIVRIFDQGDYDGAHYYAMEFVDGVSLDSLLEAKEKMEPLRALRIIRACAEALQHSHAQGIIHRDIKPANIMLTTQEEVKLTDFGIAKVLDATRMTATQGVLGTVEYMSPEQSQGRHVDGRSDLYSLGVVLYQCLTARLPISGTTPTEIIMKLRTQQVDAPSSWAPGLPRSMDDLVARMLAKEPAKRIESAKELIREIDRVEGQISSGALDPASISKEAILTSTQESSPWRNPWLIICIVGVLGLTTYLLVPGKKSDPVPENATVTTVASSEGSRPQIPLLVAAMRARGQGNLDCATDICNLIIKYYPGSKQAEQAVKELDLIDQARKAAAKAAQEKGTPTLTPGELPQL